MIFPNISALKKLINNYFPGAPNTTQDYLQLIEQSSGRVVGWVDERGLPQGSLALPPISEDADAASIWLEDDFLSANGTTSTGSLNWIPGVSVVTNSLPYAGNVMLVAQIGFFENNTGTALTLSKNTTYPQGFSLTLNTGWEATFVFQWPELTSGGVGAINPNQKRLYLGFAFDGNYGSPNLAFTYGRPSKFIGLRFDTDPGNASYTLNAAANASNGNTVYTASNGFSQFNAGFDGAYVGQTFVVTDFLAPYTANNGTFECVASSGAGKTVTLNNPNGVAVTASATATLQTPSIADTTYHFECFQNALQNSNIQGATGGVFDTGIAPDNNWHRFRMRSIVQGEILFSLDGGTETMISMGMDAFSGTSLSIVSSNDIGYNLFEGAVDGLQYYASSPAWGSNLIVSGSTHAANNTSWLVGALSSAGGSIGINNGTVGSATPATDDSGNANLKFSWYNTFQPVIIFGNDSQYSSPPFIAALSVDYFSFVYNPRLALDFNQTANKTLPRYYNPQT
jgi:hypothetical protein